MIYQLPNGKVIQISVEQYLDLTDEDIQYLCNPSHNHGNYPTSLWFNSSLSKKKKVPQEDVEIDRTIDFTEEDEDKSHGDNIPQEDETLDDYLELPDESTLD